MPRPEVAERSPPILPGTTQLTVMPCGANSDAIALVRPTMPILPVPTWARPGAPRWVETPPRLMMRPYLFLSMCGSTAREHRNAPSRMTLSTSCHCLRDMSRKCASARTAALLIRISTRPKVLITASTIVPTAASSVTSARCTRARPPAFSTSAAVRSASSRSSREEAERTAAEVEKAGGRALVHLADVTDEAAVGTMVDTVVKTFGRVDILINNAAVRAEAHFLDMSLKQWREVLSVILDGAFLCSRAVLPHMLKNKYGRIINLGGVSTHLGAPGRAHVGTGKMGIVGLTKAIASEFAPHGITVNCVVPGKIGGERSATSGRGIQAVPPVGREGVPDD